MKVWIHLLFQCMTLKAVRNADFEITFCCCRSSLNWCRSLRWIDCLMISDLFVHFTSCYLNFRKVLPEISAQFDLFAFHLLFLPLHCFLGWVLEIWNHFYHFYFPNYCLSQFLMISRILGFLLSNFSCALLYWRFFWNQNLAIVTTKPNSLYFFLEIFH